MFADLHAFRQPGLHGRVRAGRRDGRRGQHRQRRPALAGHRRRRAWRSPGRAAARRHGELRHRARLLPQQQDPRRGQRRQDRAPVERGEPRAPRRARPAADRAVRVRVGGGVQPRRARRSPWASPTGLSGCGMWRSPRTRRSIATLATRRPRVLVAFSPSGDQLAAPSFEGTVHLWDTSPAPRPPRSAETWASPSPRRNGPATPQASPTAPLARQADRQRPNSTWHVR